MLDVARYVDQPVTITGQFSGRNLTGDLPDSPRQSRYDFVLRAADAAVWVTNMRPRGKDARGENFELSLDGRLDTGKWLRVSGKVRRARGLVWIDAEPGTFALAQPSTETVVAEEAPVRVPAAPPAEVIFSAPTEDETDVPLATSIRIQFSRDVDPATFKGRIRVTYPDAPAAGARAAAPLRFHHPVRSLQPGARTEVHEATRTLPHAQGGAARRHHGDRSAAAQAVDAHLPAGRIVDRELGNWVIG